jgi:hypothetical protein
VEVLVSGYLALPPLDSPLELALAVAGEAVPSTTSRDTSELLHVDVDELTRVAALIAIRRLERIEPRALSKPEPLQPQRNRRHSASTSAISAPVIRTLRNRSIAVTRSAVSRAGDRPGLEERSANCPSPPRKRASHFDAVRVLQPAASAASHTFQPSSTTRRHSKRRLLGQVRWLAWSFIRSSFGAVASTTPASREARMNNVLRNYI